MRQDGKPIEESNPASRRVKSIKEKVTRETKKLFNIHTAGKENAEDYAYSGAIEELEQSPVFNSGKFLSKARIRASSLPARAITTLKATTAAVTNPKDAIKARVTKTTAGKLAKSRPSLSRQVDLEFLEAQDDFEQAEHATSCRNGEMLEPKNNRLEASQQKVERLGRAREDMRAAWVTERHIQRVMVVDEIAPPPFPNIEFFEKEDDCGVPELQLGKWIGFKLLQYTHCFMAQYIDDFDELPFDFDNLRRHVERLIIVSAPLQMFISDIRRIYRWEDPTRTAKWMLTYWFLWYISHIMTFALFYICYTTIKNYYFPSSVDTLREGIERSITRGVATLKVGELMDKHGNNDWLGPLLEEISPHVQVQTADLASLLEVLYNFYHFKSPRATMASLFFFFSLLLISAFGDARFTLQVFWFIFGVNFFICWPISSLHPRYRLLVSPFKWVFWDVPNHAEWSFNHLQQRSAIVRQAILDNGNEYGISERRNDDLHDAESISSFHTANSTLPEMQDQDLLSFICTYAHRPGHMILSTTCIRFQPLIAHLLPKSTFEKPYKSLLEMTKRQSRTSILSPLAKITNGIDKLELTFRGDGARVGPYGRENEKSRETILLDNMRGRDKAFNAIAGFSGLRWQHLQV